MAGVGPQRSKQLKKININSIFDLFWHIPRAYFNRNDCQNIQDICPGQKCNIKGMVVAVNSTNTRSRINIFKAMIQDEWASVTAVWFNQPFLKDIIKPGQKLFLSGRIKLPSPDFLVEEYELLNEKEEDLGIVPIYQLSEGISQKRMRSLVLSALKQYIYNYPDILPPETREKYQLCDIEFAFNNIHYPLDRASYARARKRLAVEEIVIFLSKLYKYRQERSTTGISHREKYDWVAKVLDSLPFKLTLAQENALGQLFSKMESSEAMNCLLQGDVGSGKTVIAALCIAKSAASGYQSAFMVPTEVLAWQHYQFLARIFAESPINISCLTGGSTSAQRAEIMAGLGSGSIQALVGTHALLQEVIEFPDLGLVIIDEQHRFGVKQRSLMSKNKNPDFLMLTATPIPRTLALTLFGDLDLVIIDEMPPGRKDIQTKAVPKAARNKVYAFIFSKLQEDKNAQAFVVCPLVEESEKQDWQAAVSLYEELKLKVPHIGIDLIHGRMKSMEKEAIMQRFKEGVTRLLISTTVIEVGVDIPKAIIMVVEQADRFGLSQLHQLRGRVGRGSKESYCFLISDPNTEEAKMRLKAMTETNDGFILAQEDMKIRGPGEFWGVRQHGIKHMKVADLTRHLKWVEISHSIVKEESIDNSYLNEYYIHKYPNADEIALN